MPYVITYEDVTDGFSSSASQADIDAYIAITDIADTCLAANGVPDVVGQRLKVIAVRHMVQEADGGQVTQQRAVSGASRSFAQRGDGSTGQLALLKSLDKWGCVYRIVSNSAPVWIGAVGRYDE